jgi:hypothetical protein
VKVSFDQLRLWYQTLDDLGAEKARIEKEIYAQLRTLFSLRADLVLYDITSKGKVRPSWRASGIAGMASRGITRSCWEW